MVCFVNLWLGIDIISKDSFWMVVFFRDAKGTNNKGIKGVHMWER
jgi:hypothetical protein